MVVTHLEELPEADVAEVELLGGVSEGERHAVRLQAVQLVERTRRADHADALLRDPDGRLARDARDPDRPVEVLLRPQQRRLVRHCSSDVRTCIHTGLYYCIRHVAHGIT